MSTATSGHSPLRTARCGGDQTSKTKGPPPDGVWCWWRTGDAVWHVCARGRGCGSRPHGVPLAQWLARPPAAFSPEAYRAAKGYFSRGCSRRVGRPAPGDVAGASRRRVRCRGAQAVEAAVRRGRLVLRRSGGGRPGHRLVKDWSRGATHLHGSPLRAGRQDLVVGEQQGRTEGDAQPASEGGAPRTTCHARM